MTVRKISLFVALLAVALGSVVGRTAQAQTTTAAAPASADPIYLPEAAPPPPPVEVGTGRQIENYENGEMRIERQVLKLSDDQLVNHGKFVEYYASGQKFAEGNYNRGVHDGPWTFWYDNENAQICKVVTFKNGRADGTWEVYREDGTLQAKKSYKDNKRDGDWVTYHEDGKTIKIEETFANGLREGHAKAFYADGKPQREMTFKNNQLDGLLSEWDQSGRKVGEVMFKDGKRDGKFIMYRPDGSTDEYLYKEGRLISTPAGS